MKQKITMMLSALLLLFGCDREPDAKPTKQVTETSSSSSVKKKKTFKPDPVPVVVDGVPPMTEESAGTFSPQGLTDAFRHATTLTMPSDVKPLTGTFKVWDESDFAGRKRSIYEARFRANPQTALHLIAEIEAAWLAKYSHDSDVRRSRATWKEHSIEGDMQFSSGTILVGVYNTYASYTETNFKIIIDPSSGNMIVRSYRGTNDSPSEREKAE